jgi:hypothetical protein
MTLKGVFRLFTKPSRVTLEIIGGLICSFLILVNRNGVGLENPKHPPTRKSFRLRSNCGATSRRGRRNSKSLAQTRQEEKFCRDCEFMLRLELFLVSRMSRQGGPKQCRNPNIKISKQGGLRLILGFWSFEFSSFVSSFDIQISNLAHCI